LEHVPEGNSRRPQAKDYVDVKKHGEKLGVTIPDAVVLLPLTFESAKSKSQLIDAPHTDTVRKLLEEQGIHAEKLKDDGQEYPPLVQHAVDWIGPTIFFTAAAISQNPEIVSIALGVISNYLTDFFKGAPKEERRARLKIVKETEDGCKSFDYEGPAENLGQVKDIMDRFDNESQN
jgi:hypothetical protein